MHQPEDCISPIHRAKAGAYHRRGSATLGGLGHVDAPDGADQRVFAP